jgi:hypothetical protein
MHINNIKPETPQQNNANLKKIIQSTREYNYNMH